MRQFVRVATALNIGLATLLAPGCNEVGDLSGPADRSQQLAFTVDPDNLVITAGRVRVCKDGPEGGGTYAFTISNVPSGVDLPYGSSFSLTAGECKVVAIATENGRTVTITESTPTPPVAFDHVDIYRFTGTSGSSGGTATLIGTSDNASVTTGTFGGDQAYVLVFTNILTSRCTVTLGFWKNHAGFTGNNGDLVTALLPQWLGTSGGAKSVQVTTATQAVDILQFMGVASNGINKLYAQLLTAKLNGANGANLSAVSAVIAAADAFLANNDSASWASLAKSQQQTVLGWMTALDNYNNGLTGPGHCGEG